MTPDISTMSEKKSPAYITGYMMNGKSNVLNLMRQCMPVETGSNGHSRELEGMGMPDEVWQRQLIAYESLKLWLNGESK